MEVKLVVSNGKQAGTEISVKGNSLLIGRGEECNLRPQSSLVSRKHCRIEIADGKVTIEDFGSTNGTFVNDQRIEGRRELHNGDQIRVGMLTFEVQLSVSVGGQKKPMVHSVQEAASRTAGSSPSLTEDLDISGWLDEEGGNVDAPTRRARITPGDTMAGKSLLDTSTLPAAPKKPEEEQPQQEHIHDSKHPPKKPIGKMKHSSKPLAENSGAAAEDALRQFFRRKK
ncbi:MAG: FHA domain-containing protein [Pirellulaceae bacterium]|nr:FHA domain-containing protein [Pirellulaceae bacterium]